jgi:hypothetical protein
MRFTSSCPFGRPAKSEFAARWRGGIANEAAERE